MHIVQLSRQSGSHHFADGAHVVVRYPAPQSQLGRLHHGHYVRQQQNVTNLAGFYLGVRFHRSNNTNKLFTSQRNQHTHTYLRAQHIIGHTIGIGVRYSQGQYDMNVVNGWALLIGIIVGNGFAITSTAEGFVGLGFTQ